MKLLFTLSLILLGALCASSTFADVKQAGDAAVQDTAVAAPDKKFEAPETPPVAEDAAGSDEASDDTLIEIQPIYVTEYVDTLDLQALDRVTNAMSKAVKLCIDQEKTNVECLCENKAQSKEYQETLSSTLASHPAWKSNVAQYTDTQGVGVTISFIGHQRQSDMLDDLECPE
jgi:hypothetical protein